MIPYEFNSYEEAVQFSKFCKRFKFNYTMHHSISRYENNKNFWLVYADPRSYYHWYIAQIKGFYFIGEKC